MTAPVVVLVEEPSARIVVEEICKSCSLSHIVKVLEHQGKTDLEKSISRKINGWKSSIAPRFIVSRDLDNNNRSNLRSELLARVPHHAIERTKIRIIVPELESWYLGDTQALMEVGLINQSQANKIRNSAKFRDLCALLNAKDEFKKIVGDIGQLAAAHLIGPKLVIERNSCRNFVAFFEAVNWAAELASAEMQEIYNSA